MRSHEELFPYSASDARRPLKSYWGFIDRRGKVVVRARHDDSGVAGGGIYYVRVGNAREFLDARGKKIFQRPMTLADLSFGGDGLAGSLDYDVALGAYRAAFIDTSGKSRPVDADWVRSPEGGLAIAARGNLVGFVSLEGRFVIAPAFLDVRPFQDDTALAALDQRGIKKWGIIDREGRWRVKPKFLDAWPAGEGGFTVTDDAKHWGVVSADGKRRIAARFTEPVRFYEGLAVGRQGPDAVGYLDLDGEWAHAPRFVDARSFSRGLAPVAFEMKRSTPRWGLIDRLGTEIVAPEFHGLDAAGSLFRWAGAYRRTKPMAWGYIDATGDVIWEGTR